MKQEIRIWKERETVRIDAGLHFRVTLPSATARTYGQLLIDHADAIDKAAHDKHAAEVLERRNKVTRRYMNANWNDLSNRVTREMVDRIIELETQQEENK